MAFRKKSDWILKYDPDILIVPECENPDVLKFSLFSKQPDNIIWYGENPNKGLGVFSFNDYKLQLLTIHNSDFKTVLPISVTRGPVDFTMFAIWANNPSDTINQYIGQVWKAIHNYDELIKNEKTILIGDFNSNTIWDKPRRKWNHSAVVEALELKQIKSTYHHHFKQVQGKEKHATFHLYRHLNKPYHLDYCFASNELMEKLQYVEIGRHEDWKMHSDHMPLIVNFNI
ncbi:MAG: hypothetical protein JWP37_4475 [Mucilaginibacter sp.]|nr:hypothetical protein [Mucilaginibacter sp.]